MGKEVKTSYILRIITLILVIVFTAESALWAAPCHPRENGDPEMAMPGFPIKAFGNDSGLRQVRAQERGKAGAAGEIRWHIPKEEFKEAVGGFGARYPEIRLITLNKDSVVAHNLAIVGSKVGELRVFYGELPSADAEDEFYRVLQELGFSVDPIQWLKIDRCLPQEAARGYLSEIVYLHPRSGGLFRRNPLESIIRRDICEEIEAKMAREGSYKDDDWAHKRRKMFKMWLNGTLNREQKEEILALSKAESDFRKPSLVTEDRGVVIETHEPTIERTNRDVFPALVAKTLIRELELGEYPRYQLLWYPRAVVRVRFPGNAYDHVLAASASASGRRIIRQVLDEQGREIGIEEREYIEAVLMLPVEHIEQTRGGWPPILREIAEENDEAEKERLIRQARDRALGFIKEFKELIEASKGEQFRTTITTNYPVFGRGDIKIIRIELPSGANIRLIGRQTIEGWRYVMIDCGPGCYFDDIIKTLQGLGISPEHDIERIIGLHIDPDHNGGLKRFVDTYGIEAFIPPNWQDTAESRLTNDRADWRYALSRAYTKLFWGLFESEPPAPHDIRTLDCPPEGLPVFAGDSGLTVRTIPAPGHTVDSVRLVLEHDGRPIRQFTGCHCMNDRGMDEQQRGIVELYGKKVHVISPNANSDGFRAEMRQAHDLSRKHNIPIDPSHGQEYLALSLDEIFDGVEQEGEAFVERLEAQGINFADLIDNMTVQGPPPVFEEDKAEKILTQDGKLYDLGGEDYMAFVFGAGYMGERHLCALWLDAVRNSFIRGNIRIGGVVDSSLIQLLKACWAFMWMHRRLPPRGFWADVKQDRVYENIIRIAQRRGIDKDHIIAIVAVNDELHYPTVEKLVKAGIKRILVEKPIAVDPAQAEKMIELRDEYGCEILGQSQLLYSQVNRRLHSFIAKKRFKARRCLKSWRKNRESRTLQNVGVKKTANGKLTWDIRRFDGTHQLYLLQGIARILGVIASYARPAKFQGRVYPDHGEGAYFLRQEGGVRSIAANCFNRKGKYVSNQKSMLLVGENNEKIAVEMTADEKHGSRISHIGADGSIKETEVVHENVYGTYATGLVHSICELVGGKSRSSKSSLKAHAKLVNWDAQAVEEAESQGQPEIDRDDMPAAVGMEAPVENALPATAI